MKFLCDQCKAKYQIADDKAAGKTVRMKCRKCGHLIEVRATAPEPTADAPVSGPKPASPTTSSTGAPSAPRKPAPPRAGGLATSLASAKSPAKPSDKPASALAGAFKSSVQQQREEEVSAPFDMSDLSPNDEWYVAINGVPVGPIRVAEVRRKAALGAVTEDSLCWQEGLDEWRAVRTFPELALIVREAAASGRSSLPPAQTGHGAEPSRSGPSTTGSRSPSVRPSPAQASRPAPPTRSTSAPLAARSNVVPIRTGLATAEKIEDVPDDKTRPHPGALLEVEPDPTAIVADPFANPPAPAAGAAMAGPRQVAAATQQVGAISDLAAAAAIAAPYPEPAPAQPKAPPWMAIAMVAAAIAFGVTAGIAVFLRPAAPPTPQTVQGPAPVAPTQTTSPTAAPTVAATDTTSPEPSATSTAPKGPVAMGGKGGGGGGPAPSATAAAHGPLDLNGIGGSNVRPGLDDPGSDGPKAPGQCFSQGQVSQVIGLHQPGIKRACWERNPTTKPAVNVSVSLTINPDGSTSGVSANSDEPTVGTCVANDVRTWKFAGMGCSQQTAFSLHFVRQ